MKVTLEFDSVGRVKSVVFDPANEQEKIAGFMAEAARDAADIAASFDGATESPLADAYIYMMDSTASLDEPASMRYRRDRG